jgi:hypothetical protein
MSEVGGTAGTAESGNRIAGVEFLLAHVRCTQQPPSDHADGISRRIGVAVPIET